MAGFNKQLLIKLYLIFEYIITIYWFTFVTFLFVLGEILLCMYAFQPNSRHTYLIPQILCCLVIYILVSFVTIVSIISTHKILKNKPLTILNKITLCVMPIISVVVIFGTLVATSVIPL